ncbi:hypothetical protein SmaMPs15_000200 [Stenotrophomonas maltophilia phage vB_SmaM_Ps15]|uniref:Uncharacterized protein n=1 Tax=Stenotrophomonas maltophilia phage vB_SmaM_Ps15 TaxID=3071007 RepID=A0AAE9FMV9_9CAUD|nr:hypothetical protein PQC01_gp200 [Stenotrophomonas maltophilia phage vB_SmaM_Ps15]QXN67474.1 hypothetical protein [Stenotrophomonas phage BUCT608]QYC97612.1 hypothetical protein [Stenotrophomonas phage BUCT608]QYW02649.1 hypothetical protein CPT_Marzo_107 [Stenotrophomonas phage Marzo]UMO77351.1 hypothetical protein SmaMPs15_000200 [Stenotrophomonas maltophilia phage vB_SmaM_Ps15]
MGRLNLYKNGRLAASMIASKMGGSVSVMLHQATKPITGKFDGVEYPCLKVIKGFEFGDQNLTIIAEEGDIFHLT